MIDTILIPVIAFMTASLVAAAYLAGQHHTQLVDKIRMLENRPVAEKPPEPILPTITGGAYQPPREIGNTVSTKRAAGIVEAKTPQQMEWQEQQEMAKLEQGA